MNELNFYNNDVGLDTSNDVQTGGGINKLEISQEGGVIRKYRKRCLEHQKRITELEKENKSLKQKIKELTK
jgi:predicted RNase H-like nuclease (RuvC/YqgF family)